MKLHKKLNFLCLAFLVSTTLLLAGFFPYPYQVKKLDNGLTVIMIPIKGSGLVSYYSVVRTGSRDEWEPGHTGFAHFFEHMMFRGTEKYPGSVYDRLITEMGANSNAYTTDDLTCYYLTFAAEDLEKVIDLESDRFKNLKYTEADFKTEAGAVYGEYLKSKANPYFLLLETLLKTAFDKHTYRHTTIGFKEDIEAMPTMYEYSKSFFSRYYRPENVVILIVGDFDPEKTFALIKKYYGDWKPGYVPPKITPEPEQKEERFAEVKYPGKTLPILAVAYKGPAFSTRTKDWLACSIFGDLAFGENSEIYKDLVLKKQIAQTIQPWFSMNRDPKLNTILAVVKKEEYIDIVKKAIDKTIEKFQREPVAKELLERQKKRMKYSFLMSLTTPSAIASRLARIVAITGGISAVDEMYELLDRITPQDVQKAVQKYFVPQKRTIVILRGEK